MNYEVFFDLGERKLIILARGSRAFGRAETIML